MVTDESRRSRRSEPINSHTADNGTKTYWFRVDVGTKPDGTRDRQRFTYSTSKEARREYRRITTEVAEGRYVPHTRITVGEYITSWLDGRRDVRRVTVEGYRHALKPVIDRLGNQPLQKLTKQHLDDLVTWRLTEGRRGRQPLGETATAILEFVGRNPEGVRYADVVDAFGVNGSQYLTRLLRSGHLTRVRRGLYTRSTDAPAPPDPEGVSERTVTTMLMQLTAALADAMDQGLVTRNVARLVRRPTVRNNDLQVWTRDQSRQFRGHVHPHRLYALFLLSLCGLRRSEVMGMEWSAVDFDAGTVEIRQGRVAVTPTETEIGDPKSWRSGRTLPVPPDVLRALRTFSACQAAEKLALGQRYPDDHDLVARGEDGTPIRPEWYGDEVKRQMTAAGVPVIRLKDMRHTAATILLDSGAQPATVAKWLGHDPAVLLRVYAHPYKEALAGAGDALFAETAESAAQ
ncbi:site-specific integrase [Nocardia terpenica]|uniref:Site-specific integrase n=2 Tax=Nocardia terpenica TaxID=455432 RepID=A0A291RWP6_9NOCA|nr:site-specific integrase [Nocardia terpenica]